MPFARSDSPYPRLCNPIREEKLKCLRCTYLAISGEAQQSAAQSARRVELEGLSGDSEVLTVPRFINAEGELPGSPSPQRCAVADITTSHRASAQGL